MIMLAYSWIVPFILLQLQPVIAQGHQGDIQCYYCRSDFDTACSSDPYHTVTCPTVNGRGCSTKIHTDYRIERGCSDISLVPNGCQVSALFESECVCHTDRCNVGIPQEGIHRGFKHNLECYQCDSTKEKGCENYASLATPTVSCPAENGCILTQHPENGRIVTQRTCIQGQSPASYYPGGCYQVYNELTRITSQVCYCYEDLCNESVESSMQAKHPKSAQASAGSFKPLGTHQRLAILLMILMLHVTAT